MIGFWIHRIVGRWNSVRWNGVRWCAAGAVLAGALLLSAPPARQTEAQEQPVFGLAEVRINRAYGFYNPKPTDKAITKLGVEVVKGDPGKIEVAVEREWYSHRLAITITAPPTVRDGEMVALKSSGVATWNLRLKEPSPSLSGYIHSGFRYQEKPVKDGFVGTPAAPITSGIKTLHAENSVTVPVSNGDGTFAGAGGGFGEDRAFGCYISSGIAGSQAILEITYVYRRGHKPATSTPATTAHTTTPKTPETLAPSTHAKCPQTFERDWRANWGIMPIRVQGTTATGTYTKSRGHYGPGTFTGTIRGRVMDIRWKDNDGKTAGTSVLTLSEDGCTFRGSNTVVTPPGGELAEPASVDTGGSGSTAGTRPGGAAGSGNPWETSAGQDCFEEWIRLATRLLNAHVGNEQFNGRKPWSFNKYGLLEAKGIASVAAPDDFESKYGGNKHAFMWDLYNTDAFGKFLHAPQVLNDARVPPLRDFVRRCSPESSTAAVPAEGMVLIAPDLVVPKGSQVLVPVRILRARDVLNLDFDLSYMPEIAAARPNAERGSLVTQIFENNIVRPGLFKFNFAQLSPVNGDGSVAGFRFDAIGPGRSRTPLTLNVHTINNSRGERLPITTINGSITIYDPSDLGDPNNPNYAGPIGQSKVQPTCSGTGRQTVNDARCCLKMWVGLTPRGMHMDVDNSGEVDSRDAVIVLQNVLSGLAEQ